MVEAIPGRIEILQSGSIDFKSGKSSSIRAPIFFAESLP